MTILKVTKIRRDKIGYPNQFACSNLSTISTKSLRWGYLVLMVEPKLVSETMDVYGWEALETESSSSLVSGKIVGGGMVDMSETKLASDNCTMVFNSLTSSTARLMTHFTANVKRALLRRRMRPFSFETTSSFRLRLHKPLLPLLTWGLESNGWTGPFSPP